MNNTPSLFITVFLLCLTQPTGLYGQNFTLKEEMYCLSRADVENRRVSKSDIFPKEYFDRGEIDLKIKKSDNLTFSRGFPTQKSRAYKPNLRSNEKYVEFLNDDNSKYGSLTHLETCVTLGADLVIKAKVLTRDDYSDTCLMYKSSYSLLIINLYKNNFDYEVGDTVVLKSIVGKEGGCAELEWMKQLEPSYPGYEYSMEIGEEGMFALSALWYYRVALSNAIMNSKSKDPVCFGYFVDPGFNLSNVTNNDLKIKDIISLLNSIK